MNRIQKHNESFQMSVDIGVCPWPKLTILRVQHLRFPFSQAIPFATQIANETESSQISMEPTQIMQLQVGKQR